MTQSAKMNCSRSHQQSVEKSDIWDLAIIGGGYRTTTFLASAPELLKYKITILEKRNILGPGAFQDYMITTSSSGKSMLKHLSYKGPFSSLKSNTEVCSISNCNNPVQAEDLATALHEVGKTLCNTLDQQAIHMNTCIQKIVLSPNSDLIKMHSDNGEIIYTNHALIATGRIERLHTQLKSWHQKTVLSQSVISKQYRKVMETKLLSMKQPSVVIAGSSHSAMSVLQVLIPMIKELEVQHTTFQSPEIIVLQRGLTPLMYDNKKQALEHQIIGRERIFNEITDTCPQTGIIFRDSGLRHISKETYCKLYDRKIENASLVRVNGLQEASTMLEQAGLIIQALGYFGNAPDIYMADQLIRANQSQERLVTDYDGAAVIQGKRFENLSVMRIEPTPMNQKDNAAYASNLYEMLAKRLEQSLKKSNENKVEYTND